MVLKTVQDGRLIDVPIRQGEMFLLPPRGAAFAAASRRQRRNRRRTAPQSAMNSMAFPGTANTADIVCIWSGLRSRNIETQLPEIFSRFYSSLRSAPAAYAAPSCRLPARDARSQRTSAAARMQRDPLAGFAGEFHHPDDGAGRKLLYLCGHSLGLQPKSAAQYVEQELKDWRRFGVLGHHVAGASVDSAITSVPPRRSPPWSAPWRAKSSP